MKKIFTVSLLCCIAAFSNAQIIDTIIFNDQWGNSYPSTVGSSYLRGIYPTSNGIITSGGYYGALTDQYTKTIDSNGVVIWSAQRAPGGDHDGWLDVDRLDNGNFICYGQQNALGTSYFDAAWVVYDTLGNEVNAGFFSIPGSTSGRCLEKLSSGNLVSVGPVGGGAAVYLTDQNMNTINNVNIYSPGWGMQSIVHDSDDVFIIGTDPGSSELLIYRFTHTLVPIDTFSYNFPDPGFVQGAVLKDNLIHLVGVKTISGNYHGFLLIIDLSGNIVYSSIDANPSAYYAICVHQNEIFYTSTNYNVGSTINVDSKIIHYPTGASHTLYGGINFNPYNMVSIGNSLYLCGELGQWTGAGGGGSIAGVIKLNVAVQTCTFSVTTQPINQTVNITNNAQFTIASSDTSATYQWQTDLGVGFQNLNSVGQYSGTANDTLTIANTTLSNNNQPFRCIISSGSCTDTSNIAVLTVNNNVGINDVSQSNLFSVYPNPASTLINVKADASLVGSVYSIYDNVGKVVLSGKINSVNASIALGNLSRGIYLFSIGGNMKQTFKVIKE